MTNQSNQLSNKALLIQVSISQWAGRKLDKKATDSVRREYLTDSQAGNYTKKLLPGAKELDRVNSAAAKVREYFYSQTAPWLADGSRIIKNSNYLEFTNEFRKLKNDFEQAVNEFIAEYPNLKAQAQKSLGNLYDPNEYPSAEQLRNKFTCEFIPMPLPNPNDFRIELSQFERDQFTAKMKEVESKAMNEVWNRLHEVVSKAAARLGDPKAVFKDSLIDNINELCALLPRLNINDDPNLEQARINIESTIATIKTDSLRKNATDRQNAAAKLAQIESAMGAFMGGAK